MTRKRTSDNDLVVSSGAAAPVRRKAAARPRAKRPAEPVETLAPVAAAEDAVALQADAAPASTPYTPSPEETAALAYSYWEARGCQGGCPEEDWLRAEEELRIRSTAVAIA